MWFGIGIKILLENRQVIELLKSEFKGKSILDCAATDYVSNCEKCHSATGWLYNETCWFRVDEIIPLAQIPHLLPGHLQDNHTIHCRLTRAAQQSRGRLGTLAVDMQSVLLYFDETRLGWLVQGEID